MSKNSNSRRKMVEEILQKYDMECGVFTSYENINWFTHGVLNIPPSDTILKIYINKSETILYDPLGLNKIERENIPNIDKVVSQKSIKMKCQKLDSIKEIKEVRKRLEKEEINIYKNSSKILEKIVGDFIMEVQAMSEIEDIDLEGKLHHDLLFEGFNPIYVKLITKESEKKGIISLKVVAQKSGLFFAINRTAFVGSDNDLYSQIFEESIESIQKFSRTIEEILNKRPLNDSCVFKTGYRLIESEINSEDFENQNVLIINVKHKDIEILETIVLSQTHFEILTFPQNSDFPKLITDFKNNQIFVPGVIRIR